MLETDAAPQPFKAKRESWTEPRHLRDIASKLAELQQTPVESVEEVTTRNVERLLGPKWRTIQETIGGATAVAESKVDRRAPGGL